ncbi:unnamed protein product [Rhizophagus irregularis]|nr:unnamed protein product [Rhizophagus irregularis]
METVRDKEVDIFIRPTNVETQSREVALIETPQTSTQHNFEKRMDSAFLSLSNIHHTFENFMNKITPNSQDTSPNNGYKDTTPPINPKNLKKYWSKRSVAQTNESRFGQSN